MIDQEARDLLTSGGRTTAKFPSVGTVHKGTVIAAKVRQATDMDTGELKFWPNGDPVKELLIDLQTDERDPQIEDDDGVRRLYAGGNLLKAIREAIAASKAGLEEGGELAVKYEADGEPKKRGWNPPKLYKARYTPPKPGAVQADDLV